ncbi:hypothetical protein HPB50_000952 [Hyalomma asiaticum]|uniref:Uncharacterized protein n=1 Tax=Hyalomma asiaticum TaxID=266040 RepID=A0ACB7T3P0_HYAAI|nr:hypothetical protein HPB50_000952 [Hyalomma asiaticum]
MPRPVGARDPRRMSVDDFLDYLQVLYRQNPSGCFNLDRDSEETSAASSLYGYEDFDYAEVARKVIGIASCNKRPVDELMDDTKAMITFYLLYGTNLSASRAVMSSVSRHILDCMLSAYNLRDGNQPRNVLTLARVSLAFGGLTVARAVKLKDCLPVPHSRMNAMVAGYPAAMMTTAFSGLIPQDEAYSSTIRDAHYLYLVELIKCVDLRMRHRPNCEVFDSFKGFASAAQEKCPLDKSERVAVMNQWGILVGGACSEAVTKAADLFRIRVQPGFKDW